MTSHRDNAGQASFTAEQIRDLLTAIEAGANDVGEHLRPLQRIKDANDLVRLAEQLVRETVADARAIPADRKRAVLDGRHVHLVDQRAGDTSSSRYGWDVIGSTLGITKQRAHKKFTPES